MNKAKKPIPEIYGFFSYHEFLITWFKNREREGNPISQREFLRKAQISGSAMLHRVLKGGKLPKKYIDSFIQAIGLSAPEAEYFRTQIEYGNSNRIEERGNAFSNLLRLRSVFPQYQMDDRALKFFKRWYYPVVREIIDLLDGSEDLNRISRMVIPPITTVQAENAIKFLEKNSFLKRNQHNRLELADPIISSGSKRKSGLLASYHLKNLEVNHKALDIANKDLISLSSLTLKISPETYEQMRNELADFRSKLLELARADQNPSQVFHLNFTFLPRSRNLHEKEES